MAGWLGEWVAGWAGLPRFHARSLSPNALTLSDSHTHHAHPHSLIYLQALKARGNAALQSQGFLEALNCYTEALLLDDHHTLYSNRSAVNMQLKRYGEALADANSCMRLAPQWSVDRESE